MKKGSIDLLRTIIEYRQEWRRSPTFGELASELGIAKDGVHKHVKALQGEGLLAPYPHRARAALVPMRCGYDPATRRVYTPIYLDSERETENDPRTAGNVDRGEDETRRMQETEQG